jgi:hypothetical protein
LLSDTQLLCRVCGLRQEEPPWGDDGHSPTYEYCACCGTEFGYQDASLTGVLRQRERWLDAGAAWAEPERKPPDWDLEAQLAQIPAEWRPGEGDIYPG